MRNARLLASTACLLILLVPTRAKADSACGVINLGSFIPTTTCTIGDKTFAFTGDQLSLNGVTSPLPSAFVITPDASNPLAPSFTISPAPGSSIMVPLDSQGEVSLNLGYTVSTTNGSATISGLDVAVSGSVSGEVVGGSSISKVEATNALSSGPGVIFTSGLPEVTACIQNGGTFLLPGCVQTTNGGSNSGSLAFATPVSSLTGIAFVGLSTGFGTATLTSATFSIDEIPQTTPTPEPSSLVLLASGVFGTFGALRRRLFR
jgi:hypothetical protein